MKRKPKTSSYKPRSNWLIVNLGRIMRDLLSCCSVVFLGTLLYWMLYGLVKTDIYSTSKDSKIPQLVMEFKRSIKDIKSLRHIYIFYRQNMMQTEGSRNCHCIQSMNTLTMSQTITGIITLYEHWDITARRCYNKWGLRVWDWHRIGKAKVIKPERNYPQIHSSNRAGLPLPAMAQEISGAKGNLATIY